MQRILMTALVAGLIAGLVSFGLQGQKLTPLILHAEVYEDAANEKAEAAPHAHETVTAHEHDAEAWEPANGAERISYRAFADIGVAVGYALLLVGAIALRGDAVDAKRGALWGLAGFAVFALAPGFGLAPELPGSMAAELFARQTWWVATAASTALGIALIVFGKSNVWKVTGVVALVIPHVIGAPEPHEIGGLAPTELSAEFAAASLTIAAVFWLVLGTVSGWYYGRSTTKQLAAQ